MRRHGDASSKRDPDLEWLDHVQPVGLVVAPILLKELGLAPSRQTQADTAVVAALIGDDSDQARPPESWPSSSRCWAGRRSTSPAVPAGPPLPDELYRPPARARHDAQPHLGGAANWAKASSAGSSWSASSRPASIPTRAAAPDGWEATPHQRFERLLRETGVFAGLLVSEKNEPRDGEDHYPPELRLVYAPRGETSGHLTFPLRALGTVAGRPDAGRAQAPARSFRLFADAADRRLPALLKKSREAQAAVSTALAEQVLGALHELLRGLDAAEPELIRELARTRPGHLYEGLLTVLMRLVFILYAEDRDLLPSRTDGRARQIYETSYSRARPLCAAQRGRRAQSRHHGRAARRLGPPARAVPADPQGPRQPFRAGARRQAVRSRCSFRSSKGAPSAADPPRVLAGLRRLHACASSKG